MDHVDISACEDPTEAFEVRRTVFVEEQDITPGLEFDDEDDTARHFLARVDGEPAGTARVRLIDQETAKIERVAVLPDYREYGVGKRVMQAAHEYAREKERSRTIVHAQTRVAGFYRSLEYETVGAVEDETGIPHVKMVRGL